MKGGGNFTGGIETQQRAQRVFAFMLEQLCEESPCKSSGENVPDSASTGSRLGAGARHQAPFAAASVFTWGGGGHQ